MMMMLKAFSTITLAAFSVRAAWDSGKTWTLHKKSGFCGKSSLPCPRGGFDDRRDSAQLRSKTEKYARIGWTIKLPKSSVFGKFKANKHEPRFVCLDPINYEVIYFKPDGTQAGSTVHFTKDDITSYKMNKLSDFPDVMHSMGYTNGNNVLAQYNTNYENKNFFFLFSSQNDWKDFHNNLVAAAGIKKEDISNANIVGTVKALDELVGVVNHAQNGDEEALKYLELNNLGGNFLIGCLVAAHLAVRDAAGIRIADDLSIQNIEAKIDAGFRIQKLKEALKEYVGLKRRRRLVTMKTLLEKMH